MYGTMGGVVDANVLVLVCSCCCTVYFGWWIELEFRMSRIKKEDLFYRFDLQQRNVELFTG